jgi:hypothetical protein
LVDFLAGVCSYDAAWELFVMNIVEVIRAWKENKMSDNEVSNYLLDAGYVREARFFHLIIFTNEYEQLFYPKGTHQSQPSTPPDKP